MVLAGNDRNADILSDIIKKQAQIDKRVERLETLEFEKYAKSDGCIRWLDYDNAPFFLVDVPANPYELGDYGWTHLTVWYGFISSTAGNKTLHMTFNAIAANYSYHYKYSRGAGAPPTIVGGAGDGAASITVANLYGSTSWTTGMVHVPLYPVPVDMGTFGWWEAYDSSQESGAKEERGDFSGRVTSAIARVTRISFFPSADNISGYLYLYGWCPTWDTASGPPD